MAATNNNDILILGNKNYIHLIPEKMVSLDSKWHSSTVFFYPGIEEAYHSLRNEREATPKIIFVDMNIVKKEQVPWLALIDLLRERASKTIGNVYTVNLDETSKGGVGIDYDWGTPECNGLIKNFHNHAHVAVF